MKLTAKEILAIAKKIKKTAINPSPNGNFYSKSRRVLKDKDKVVLVHSGMLVSVDDQDYKAYMKINKGKMFLGK